MSTIYLRKIPGPSHMYGKGVYKSYDSEADAISDTLSKVGQEVYRANLESLGEITKVLVPTRVLQKPSVMSSEAPRPKYPPKYPAGEFHEEMDDDL